MRTNPRLQMKAGPDRNIWACFSIPKVTPVLMDGFLLVILAIPLINMSLQIDVYNIHNLPALIQVLWLQFSYILKGQYLAISKHGTQQNMTLKSAWLLKDTYAC